MPKTSPTSSIASTSRGPKGQPTLLARLQALLSSPTTVPNPPTNSLTPSDVAMSKQPVARTAKFLKIRIVTWNMHDSLPKGNLEELLGRIPPYTKSKAASNTLPNFPCEDGHPYHVVVVAGQECPSTLGIPMGFGAGFKLIDKDKDKDWEKHHEDGSESDRSSESDEGDGEDNLSKLRKSSDNDAGNPPSGWTAMVENWLCNGGGTLANLSDGSPTSSTISGIARKGPYSMLIKERLMGLYLAVYVHRDVRSLVKGASKSYVKAGLIGGRVGNKGGVGISLNISGTTILLLNAHLAAHEGKINHRLANLAKIKAELSVEDFLSPDDPRTMAEDLTDKYDYTFIFGDLNFRLDISRLHADWLISHQDYANALEFDQLRKLMRDKQAFFGFNEAKIDFPPTFKYDVLRTLKRPKRKLTKLSYSTSAIPTLVEAEERQLDPRHSHDYDGERGERASIASSAFTSVHSRPGTDIEDDESLNASQPSPLSRALSTPGGHVSLNAAAHKVKEKWLSLLSSPRVSSSPPKSPSPQAQLPDAPPVADAISTSISLPIEVQSSASGTPAPETSLDVIDRALLQPPVIARIHSTKSTSKNETAQNIVEDGDKGVYDTSQKKRVPSWCDRILWKSTVKLEEPLPEGDEVTPRQRNIVQQLLSNLRPGRRASLASPRSLHDVGSPNPPRGIPETSNASDTAPFSRFVSPLPRQSVSHEYLPLPPDKSLVAGLWPFGNRNGKAVPMRRSMSVASSDPPPQMAIRPDRTLRRASVPGGPYNSRTGQQDSSPGRRPDATPKPQKRWSLLPSFLSRDPPNMTSPTARQSSADIALRPRRGDVICLSYNTLDDKAMRRLEGRSDHRPVIGSYAIYI